MEPENSVNTELVEEGVAMVSRKPRRWVLAQAATMHFLKGGRLSLGIRGGECGNMVT